MKNNQRKPRRVQANTKVGDFIPAGRILRAEQGSSDRDRGPVVWGRERGYTFSPSDARHDWLVPLELP